MTSPWTDYLAQTGAHFAEYDVTFPPAKDESGETLMIPLVHLGLIRSSGDESAPFLHNLLSNDVKKLAGDAVQWSSFNTPKGRMLASLLVFGDSGGHGLVLSADIQPAILKRLSMYVLRSKVRISDGSTDTALVGLSGASASEVLRRAGLTPPAEDMQQTHEDEIRCIRLNDSTFILLAPLTGAPGLWERLQASGAHPAGTDAWHLAMIRAGLPLVTSATQEEFVAQMLNFELIGGVSFSKGCYPGQEIVARTQYLGKLKKRMYRVHVPEGHHPRPGEDVYTPEFGAQSAGKLVNVAPLPGGGYEALAVLQNSCASAGEVHVSRPDGPSLSILQIPYELP